MITYEFFDNNAFLILKIKGDLKKKYFLGFLQFIYKKADTVDLHKMICDFRETHFKFNSNDLKDLINLRLEYSHINNTEVAYLITEANEFILANIYAKEIPQGVANIHICSTVGYAINQLSLIYSEPELESMISKLSNRYEE